MNIERKLNEILDFLNKYKDETNCKGVVLGISGGKDSTVVAMLAKKVWSCAVLGVLMPSGEQTDIDDSIEICKQLELENITINIGGAVTKLKEEIGYVTTKAATNIPPRIRMTTLYAIAQTIGFRVIGTGNGSEGFIGWTTKWGDSAYDFNPIAHLTCTEVIAIGKLLAKELGLNEKFISKVPSDGLTGKSDEDNFGFSYTQLDNYIYDGTSGNENIDAKISMLNECSKHKRRMPYIVGDDL